MKITDSKQDYDAQPFTPARGGEGIEKTQARLIAEEIWPVFKTFMGTTKGKAIDLSDRPTQEQYGFNGKWPSLHEFRQMDPQKRCHFMGVCKVRLRGLFNIFREKMGDDKHKFFPTCNYMGDGRVVIWWRYSKGRTGSRFKHLKVKAPHNV